MPKTTFIKRKNTELIRAAIYELNDINYDSVSTLLPELLTEGKLILDSSVYTPVNPAVTDATGIGRYLVYDHPDKENPFSIWIFALAPRQKTSIHDHMYKGTVTVLQAPVTEKFYLPTTESSARRIGFLDRERFHTNKDDLKGTYVHQLKRRKAFGEGVSVTLHIYNMEAQFINEEGNTIDRRNLDKIYIKDKPYETIDPDSDDTEPYSSSFHP